MKKSRNLKKLNFDDLITYSPWPKRILDIERFDIRYKSPSSIHKEFNIEKWGAFQKYQKNKINLDIVDNYFERFDENICYVYRNNFYLDKGRYVFENHINVYSKIIEKYLEDSDSLVELGAGYGSKIINISKKNKFKKLKLFAAEYTEKGMELMDIVAKKELKNIKIGFCDFFNLSLKDLKIPKKSIIFTSYSLHYIKKYNDKLVSFFLDHDPKVVINFEPCYELYSIESIYGLMCKKYNMINDYNINLFSLLKKKCR